MSAKTPARTILFSVTIDDCRVDTFCSGGPGGQHQNATKSGVRIVHPPSGAIGESREDRHQINNKRLAFRRLAQHPKMKLWLAAECQRLDTGKTIEQVVDDEMLPCHLKLEVRDAEGKWAAVPFESVTE